MRRTRVALLFGGRSTEHAVSCVSAGSVLAALDRDRYDVLPIGVRRDGAWLVVPDDPSALQLSGSDLPSVETGRPVALAGDPTVGLLTLDDGSPLEPVDVVFPLLHGPYGEDGTVQGLLELAGLPYVGSGVLASAAAMDKVVGRHLLHAAGLPLTPAVVVRPRQWEADPSAAREQVAGLGLPVFVKPARGGSSIGISRVREAGELDVAVEAAFACDSTVLVEAAVAGREVECGLLEGPDGEPLASVPGEILVASGGFYDFESKYLAGGAKLDVPADLPAGTVAELQALAVRAWHALGCRGLARVDFFVGAGGRLTVNEVNTMPGFTPSSMYPRLWAASGVPYPELLDRLVEAAARGGPPSR